MTTIIASGPVIIEEGKVLLNKEKKEYGTTPWLFPGGQAKEHETDMRAVCEREVNEEKGIKIEIIKSLPTVTLEEAEKKYILYHFLAKRIGDVVPSENIAEWGWFDMHNLPSDCAPNIYDIIKDLQ